MPEMATSPEIAPVSSPPLNNTPPVLDEKLSTPAASPVPTPPASPPPAPPLSPPPASPPINSPPVSPPPYSPPPSSPPPPSNPPPPDSSPPLLPPPIASPPPPTSPPLSPPTQSQSPPPPELAPPPPSPSPPDNPDNQPSSPLPPAASPPPPPSTATNTPLAPANNSIQIPVFSPPPPGVIVIVQPPPVVVGKYSPPSQPASSPITPTVGSAPSPPASARSLPPPQSSSGNTIGIIIGVAVVAGFLGVVAVICIVLLKRKKRQPYYIDPGCPPTGGDPYYSNWNSPMTKIPPTPPGVMGAWGATPSPPPPGVMATPPVGWQPQPLNTSNEYTPNSGQQQLQQQQQRHYGPLSSGGGAVGGGAIGGFSKFQFTYEELAAATGRFSKANLLGQGGFGYVHKGVLPDGKQVAVKSLKDGSGQGEREFQAEVEIISRVHHRHLVSLVGYCMGENQRMLVYEFVPNKTLEFHLHGKGQPVMDWATRLKIALGAAKGLAYLHEDCHPRIIHRDIKAANILLDDNNEAMVADFGLAKLTSDNLSHISTRVMGTFGYLAPEYATTGKLTEKSDVFSFGVMLLELITGKKPVDPINKFAEDCLVDWARPRITKAIGDVNYDELVDPRLEGKYSVQEMARMISCAAASIRHSARRRPKMSQIVRALDGDPSVDLNSDPDGTLSETDTYNTDVHNAEMMKLKKMVMSSNDDFTSSEYGATNEYSNEFLHDQSPQHNNVTRS